MLYNTGRECDSVLKVGQVKYNSDANKPSRISRREFVLGTSSIILTGCGEGGTNENSEFIAPLTSVGINIPATSTSTIKLVSPDSVSISSYYKAEHGANLQPAIQAAFDHSAATGIQNVVNDLDVTVGELWCPVRTSRPGLAPDGIPLVVREAINVDFRNAQFVLKGPGGRDRLVGQQAPGFSEPWLGGWLYVIGHPRFGRVAIQNVKVDAGYPGPFVKNLPNLTDKGFRVQDTDVDEVNLTNVELCNFGGEIYYTGGISSIKQVIKDCHFHGSPQCAFNPGVTGYLQATNVRAGNAYQAVESLGGKGQSYSGCTFYGAGDGGASFLGGPSPTILEGYPFWYAHWDGVGQPPYVVFNDTVFERCGTINLGSWMRGSITATDTIVNFMHDVGHLRDIDLKITSWCDRWQSLIAVTMGGPPDLSTQMNDAPQGFFLKPPSDIALSIECRRTQAAIASGLRHEFAVRHYAGLIDGRSVTLKLSGEALNSWNMFANEPSGFARPQIDDSAFTTLS